MTDEEHLHLINYQPIPKDLPYVEKVKLLVARLKTEDIAQFKELPYRLDLPIKKHIESGGHPFAYLKWNHHNIKIAKSELGRINKLIADSIKNTKFSIYRLKIPIHKIVFHKYSENYGYSRLMCVPYTVNGKISKHPIELSFMSRLNFKKKSVLGNLRYNVHGNVIQAWVAINKTKCGWYLNMSLCEGVLCVDKIEYASFSEPFEPKAIVYQRD